VSKKPYQETRYVNSVSIDTVGVHYSGTLWRWYRNWLGNAENVKAKYGERWYRIWELFLAWSTVASRQGINGWASQFGIFGALSASRSARKATLAK
jgi:cyclopropane fatty-acyl-phospholipid synthase-like methyltransferase